MAIWFTSFHFSDSPNDTTPAARVIEADVVFDLRIAGALPFLFWRLRSGERMSKSVFARWKWLRR